MTITLLLSVGFVCFFISGMLLLWAYRNYKHDPWLYRPRKEMGGCVTCRNAVDEINRTSITGSWTCPTCGTPHSFVNGQYGHE